MRSFAVMVIDCSFPVSRSFADTVRIPLVSISNVTSICGTPAGETPGPVTTLNAQRAEDGGESGGYARLKTAIDAEKAAHPDALLVDGGDFSIGSLIQTLYTTQAAELRTMGALGYDAATIGNHEFDHTGLGFAQMLNAAADARDAAWAALDEAQPDQPGPLDVFQEL